MADGGAGGPGYGFEVRLGDPAPWFSAPTLDGGRIDLHVDAGRWVVLAFLGRLTHESARRALAGLLQTASLFSEGHLVCYAVLAEEPTGDDRAALAGLEGPALNFIADYDGNIARRFGADGRPRTYVLDSMLRAVADIPLDHPDGHDSVLHPLLRGLPPVDESAGTRLSAPVLIVPRVFEFELCDLLVELFDADGGRESGFLLDQNGMTRTLLDPALKRRRDCPIGAPELQALIRERIVARVVPAIERYFSFAVTRMDRSMVSRYGAEDGGHFFRHRDNLNAGAAHRRFAMTIGLNKDFEGGGLRFPEFGSAIYTAPVGGAVIFSCGMLHEVLPVMAGARYVFVPFFYGEADAARRLENNRFLAADEAAYDGGGDRLFAD